MTTTGTWSLDTTTNTANLDGTANTTVSMRSAGSNDDWFSQVAQERQKESAAGAAAYSGDV